MDYIEGSDNVFKDIGSRNPEEKMAKSELVFIINQIIAGKGLTQKEAAKFLGVDQSAISALKNGRLTSFSIEQLFFFLGVLDQHVDIVVRRKSKDFNKKTINVAYA